MGNIIGSLRKRFYDETGLTLKDRQAELPSLGNNWNSVRSFITTHFIEVQVKRRIEKDGGYTKYRTFLATGNFYVAKAYSIALGRPLKKPKQRRDLRSSRNGI